PEPRRLITPRHPNSAIAHDDIGQTSARRPLRLHNVQYDAARGGMLYACPLCLRETIKSYDCVETLKMRGFHDMM
ncbi:hypothetical protein, partial [Acidiphilium sp.]|uniref:hypothetical protein n=1 Tax=Acidiphilium sp. TaxID=527 RepID=UPI002B70628F